MNSELGLIEIAEPCINGGHEKNPGLRRTSDAGLGYLSRVAICIAIVLVSFTQSVRADPSQDAVFKSISSNVDSSVSGKTVLAGVMVVAGLVMLMAFLSRRQDRRDTVKTVNSQAKLMRELIKTAGLKPAEARQLRTLADKLAKAGRPVDSPITLMLAPSWVKSRQS